MSRASILVVIGVLAILAPFSGLPLAFRTLIAIALGAAVIGIGVALRSAEQRHLVVSQSTSAPAGAPAPQSGAGERALAPAAPQEPRAKRAPKTISPI